MNNEAKIRLTVTIDLSQSAYRGMCFMMLKHRQTAAEFIAEALSSHIPEFRHRKSGDIVRAVIEEMTEDELKTERAAAIRNRRSFPEHIRQIARRPVHEVMANKQEEFEF
jgi:hypothetical protein